MCDIKVCIAIAILFAIIFMIILIASFILNPLKWIMDRYEMCSLVALFLVYKVIILLIVIYEITECWMSQIKQILNIGNHSTY